MNLLWRSNLPVDCTKHMKYGNDFSVINEPGKNLMVTQYRGHTSNNYYDWYYNRTKKGIHAGNAGAMYYPANRKYFYRWNARNGGGNDRRGGNAWRESSGRFMLKYCPDRAINPKGTYEALGLPMM